ncbi:APC family permease [Cyanobium sp. NIES-981]|uniref:APC family permease n=1 Tax=Cyanobium sp. NIES-981 TaxID=1851505 RepID=UPI0007DDE7D6|nr:APC family permease [Cyanobium sp. NIES-981]SBO43953.1 putative Amino acid permease-associated region [Cyanobium sp. NIES-981]
MSSPAPGKLQQVLGLGFGLAGAVGGTIGAGILVTPGLVAAQLAAPWLILAAWLLGGLYAVLGALCVAELASSLPRAGGWYVYAERAFGLRAGGLVGWTDWLAHCIGLAWVATTTGELVALLLPAAALPPQLISLLAIAAFGLIQWRGVKAGSASQELLSLAKAAAFLALVLACFLLPVEAGLDAGLDAATAPDLAPPPLAWGGLSLALLAALQPVITTYDGWASPIYFSEEFTDPAHDLPRSLIGGVLAVLALYLLINAALLHVLSPAQLADSPLPAADAAKLLAGAGGGVLITGVALVALLGLINTVVMAAPRILYGLSRDGLFPATALAVNAGGTPTGALGLTLALTAVLVLAGSFEHLLAMAAFLYVGLPLVGIAALITLRLREPGLARPFRLPAYPLAPLLIALVSTAFLTAALLQDTTNSLAALALAAVGLLIPRRQAEAPPAAAGPAAAPPSAAKPAAGCPPPPDCPER